MAPAIPPSSRINLRDELEVGFWCFKLQCSREELFAAARVVGTMSGDIRRHLGR